METIPHLTSVPNLPQRTPARIAAIFDTWLARPRWMMVTAIGFSLILQQIAQTILNASYSASGYPVPYYEGQLSFSATKLEGWYSQMQAEGTLGVYWQTQFIDFGFIIATALLHFTVLMFLIKILPSSSLARRIGVVILIAGLAAPLFDVLENMMSFVNLTQPTAIWPPFAIIYSLLATAKFLGFVAAYLWVPVALIWATVSGAKTRSTGDRTAG